MGTKKDYGCNKCQTFDDLMDFYSREATTYDKDVENKRGYIGYESAAEVFANTLKRLNFPAESKVLDVGAGTGLVGEALLRKNFINIDALDASEPILKEAEKKGIYKKFLVDILGPKRRLKIENDAYDGAIAVGVFTLNHVKAEGAMDEMARVVRPGGLVCFTIREDVMFDKEYGYEGKMDELCRNKIWTLMSHSKEQYHTKGSNDCMSCYVYIYQVLE